jgi:hypothetical protein
MVAMLPVTDSARFFMQGKGLRASSRRSRNLAQAE